ncbi:hypothetical protein F2Q68_00024312 [Brassica cretica]|uniref:Uncharacterized protein n=1 Tax=Brassica cretica TaxID=69181 RepID=A0A8S9I8P6_BRACR|nr:hypothetical protein F2Q68_00024312 [Brassica cretica]
MEYEPPRDWWGVWEINRNGIQTTEGLVGSMGKRGGRSVQKRQVKNRGAGKIESRRVLAGRGIHCKEYRLHPREPDAECTRAGGSTGTQQEKGRVGPLELRRTISGNVDVPLDTRFSDIEIRCGDMVICSEIKPYSSERHEWCRITKNLGQGSALYITKDGAVDIMSGSEIVPGPGGQDSQRKNNSLMKRILKAITGGCMGAPSTPEPRQDQTTSRSHRPGKESAGTARGDEETP